jgi:hypothetical protein
VPMNMGEKRPKVCWFLAYCFRSCLILSAMALAAVARRGSAKGTEPRLAELFRAEFVHARRAAASRYTSITACLFLEYPREPSRALPRCPPLTSSPTAACKPQTSGVEEKTSPQSVLRYPSARHVHIPRHRKSAAQQAAHKSSSSRHRDRDQTQTSLAPICEHVLALRIPLLWKLRSANK